MTLLTQLWLKQLIPYTQKGKKVGRGGERKEASPFNNIKIVSSCDTQRTICFKWIPISLSYIFYHYYNSLIMLSSRFISQNFLWLRETLLSESFPVTCTLRHSTLAYNSSVPALLGGARGRGRNDCICEALWALDQDWLTFLVCF